MSLSTFAALAALLIAPLPSEKGDGIPQTPDVADTKKALPSKGSSKKAPPKQGAPKTITPPAVPGMRFLYVTPAEFVSVGEIRVENSTIVNSAVLTNTRITGSGGGGSLIGNSGRVDLVGTAAARIHVPPGSRIRWMDCALDGLETGAPGTTRVFATLFRVRYADHPWVVAPYRVAALQIEMTNDVGNNGRTFAEGVQVDDPRAVETDDGWFTLEVGFAQSTPLGLRACRIGYVPPAP